MLILLIHIMMAWLFHSLSLSLSLSLSPSHTLTHTHSHLSRSLFTLSLLFSLRYFRALHIFPRDSPNHIPNPPHIHRYLFALTFTLSHSLPPHLSLSLSLSL